MKAFRFRMDPVVRWRAAQVALEENRVAASAARLAAIRNVIEQRKKDLEEGAAALTQGSAGDALQAWAAWSARCERDIRDLRQHGRAAEQTLAADRDKLVQANRNRQLIGKLRESALSEWQGEMSRELETFAGEAFLRQVTIGKRTGA